MSAEPVAAQQPPWMRVVRSVNVRDYGIVVAFLALFIGLTFSTNTFFTQNNFANILDQWAALGLLAIGETICIIAGVFDLSTGAMVSVTGVVACKVALSVSPTMGLVAGVATNRLREEHDRDLFGHVGEHVPKGLLVRGREQRHPPIIPRDSIRKKIDDCGLTIAD